jgi:hypothetical protein
MALKLLMCEEDKTKLLWLLGRAAAEDENGKQVRLKGVQ